MKNKPLSLVVFEHFQSLEKKSVVASESQKRLNDVSCDDNGAKTNRILEIVCHNFCKDSDVFEELK